MTAAISNLFAVLFALTSTISIASQPPNLRFTAIEIYIESEDPVAAWQFELNESSGRMLVVGVENGESAAYSRAPYFDIEAVRLGTADRIIVADYSLAPTEKLPRERTRIATIHVQVSGDDPAVFDLRLITAVNADGIETDAFISFETPTEN